MAKNVVRIGGASGFWGDASMATPQLLADGKLDYIVYDYLAEITMSIMARARAKSPDLGFATDFVSLTLKSTLREIAKQGVKIISNAGGVNPHACADAVRALIAEQGLDLKVATVTGDDLIASKAELLKEGPTEMFSGEAFPDPEKILSINAYLGAFPIAKALSMGADIIITGRCVDSAVTLGACIYEFGWNAGDLDRLAQGSLAGHILECGPQATGGNFTDWEEVIDRLADIGYPIAEISADGSFVCTKPEGTGGVVNVGTVSEQMLYEIGDPQAYMLPDVVCDFSTVEVAQVGDDRVHVSGAVGTAAPDTYKVSATFADGFRGGLIMTFYGMDASRKAERFSEAVFERAGRTLRSLNLGEYTETSVEVIGAESQYGAARRIDVSREVVVKMAAKHSDALGITILLKEATGLGLATPPGLSGFAGGRPRPMQIARLFSFATTKNKVAIEVAVEGDTASFVDAPGTLFRPADLTRPDEPVADMAGDLVAVPLVALAWARSGDKGNKANIGVIARKAEYFPYICEAMTVNEVTERFAHFLEGGVDRFVMPTPNALNFLLHDVLGGGGVSSLRNDPQAKGYSQLLLECPIKIPAALASRDNLNVLEEDN
ncbi:MAG: terpene utilization protein AtuA [Rhodobiaceae bacterium]|nr:MAG: terpene utilization protein AtuA [Rhodobiaceae bacterium]